VRPARLIPAGIAIIAVTYGLARYAYGLFLPDIRADFGLDTALLGVIASGSYAAFLAGTAVSSVVSARTGPRLPVVIGGMSATAGMLMVGVAGSPFVLAAGVILAGSGSGWAYPPMPDAVARLISEESRGRTLGAINSGTSYGVMVAGPVALLAGSAWRGAWLAFAALALIAAIWNAALLPGKGGGETASLPRLRWSWFVCPRSGPLLVSAFVTGLTSTVYWTYAVDLVSGSEALPGGFGEVFFVIIGAAGVLGAFSGGLADRVGLRRVLRLAVLTLAASLCALPLTLGSPVAVAGSGLLFGAAFITMTGASAVWVMEVFGDRPSAGLGAYLLVFSFGQLLGPLVVGLVADPFGLSTAFLAAAAITAAVAPVGPRRG
jgi:predicted MFS family arabinose efflux permease